MASVYFISLGCDKNRIDAETMAQRLLDAGHTVAADITEADIALINTCGFIDSAKEEAIDNIFDMVREKQAGRIKGILVTGCLAQRYAHQVRAQIPEVDAVVGLAHNQDICAVVEEVLRGETVERFGDAERLCVEGRRALSTPPHYAYLKIAEGCSNHCTYCAIPGIRGRYRSRRMADILAEARWLAAQGVRELILIAQDTTSYGSDLAGSETLAALLEALCGIEPLWKIRVLYAYPEKIDDSLIAVMARQDKIAKYLDIPMQHADAAVLRRMGRFGSEEQLLGLIERLRAAMPDITLRSTFIVGFPGETQHQFESLLAFLQRAQLDRAGCFAYSAEEGTAAARLPQQLEEETKAQRAEQFAAVQGEILYQKQLSKIGQIMQVICDGYDEAAGAFACRGEVDAPDIDTCVYLPPACDLMPGELYTVRITGTDGVDLTAEICAEDHR